MLFRSRFLRKRKVESTAVFFGWLITTVCWDFLDPRVHGYGMMVGLAAPILWRIGIFFADKKWPGVKVAASGSKSRAQKIEELEEIGDKTALAIVKKLQERTQPK